jgi:hypothetical protein
MAVMFPAKSLREEVNFEEIRFYRNVDLQEEVFL